MLVEPMEELFSRSERIFLDFHKITDAMHPEVNIQHYFQDLVANNRNPRKPENRQEFNNRALAFLNARYLIGRYGEDRIALLADTPAGKQGRTIHMALDIFAKDLEPVFAPASGVIVRSGYEEGFGEYGNYIILQPGGADYYIFFGHLANNRSATGSVKRGQLIGYLGDYADNENGGWSRHLHLQILTTLPAKGTTPPGYSTKADLALNQKLFPDPLTYFTRWR